MSLDDFNRRMLAETLQRLTDEQLVDYIKGCEADKAASTYQQEIEQLTELIDLAKQELKNRTN